jgi:hypothetical protein
VCRVDATRLEGGGDDGACNQAHRPQAENGGIAKRVFESSFVRILFTYVWNSLGMVCCHAAQSRARDRVATMPAMRKPAIEKPAVEKKKRNE